MKPAPSLKTPFSRISPFWIFGSLYLLFVLCTFRQYGITDDEHGWYTRGAFLLKYFYNRTSIEEMDFQTGEHRVYTYLYPALLHIVSLLNADKLHFFNMLFALLIYWAVYKALEAAYQKPFWALLGPFFLFLTFRFSGDIPANPKDGPFAVLYFVTLTRIYLSRTKPRNPLLESIFLGSLIGWTASFGRVIGLSLLPIWVLYNAYDSFSEARSKGKNFDWSAWLSKEWVGFFCVFFVSQFWLMAFWPYLGSDYMGHLFKVFSLARTFQWTGSIIFMGQKIPAPDLPRYYLPVIMTVTLPLFVLVFSWASPFLLWSKKFSKPGRLFVLLATAFFLNLSLYLVLKPTIFNGLRHFLYLIPILCVIGTLGLIETLHSKIPSPAKKTLLFLVGLNVLSVLVELFRLFPYQYIYYNELVGGFGRTSGIFEQEYWAASQREAIVWLREHEATDSNKVYRVKIHGTPWQSLYYFRPNMQGEVDMKDPDYEVIEDPPPGFTSQRPLGKVIHIVKREGVPLFHVMKYRTVH